MGLIPTANAQSGDFQIANRLMQQQNYEEALPILEELYTRNPSAQIFFDRYVECLINLNELEKAEEVARRQVGNNSSLISSTVKLAEILHIKGDKEEAFENWQKTIENNPESIQAYYSVATSMNKRREYNRAVEIYRKAQEQLNNPTLFLNELANTYMQAARFEEAVREYYRLVVESPDQMGMVQQRFLRMRDADFYQTASFELEDLLFDLDMSHMAYTQLYQLLTWLLLETEEYDRAYNFATYYENQTPYTIYSLMSLGSQLQSAGVYPYAIRAFEYYAEKDQSSHRARAIEELAATYRMWAQHLRQNNLETDLRQRELFQKAYSSGERLMKTTPNYDRAERVFSLLIDLSLDEFKDIEKARYWYDQMKHHSSTNEAYELYAEGRIALFERSFTSARQALTRADRATQNSNLSEQSRYYLSLSDFFAGDFEFADIQLKSLERRHSSFYANDAVKLRMWIKNGQRADTTGSVLKAIGEGLFLAHTGNYEDALKIFEPILLNSSNPFADELTVELSRILPSEYNMLKLMLLERQIENRSQSPQRERMMWDFASLAEEMLEHDGFEMPRRPPYIFSFFNLKNEEIESTAEDRFFGRDRAGKFDYDTYARNLSRFDAETVSELFEDIILEFPDGFYSSYSRDKLQTLELNYL